MNYDAEMTLTYVVDTELRFQKLLDSRLRVTRQRHAMHANLNLFALHVHALGLNSLSHLRPLERTRRSQISSRAPRATPYSHPIAIHEPPGATSRVLSLVLLAQMIPFPLHGRRAR